MRNREGEAERQAYLTKRMNDADIATREYVSKHAYEIGLAEGRKQGHIERIHFVQRHLRQPLTAKEELRSWTLDDLTAFADELERQALLVSETR